MKFLFVLDIFSSKNCLVACGLRAIDQKVSEASLAKIKVAIE
jgi:hypothetical protein